MGKKIMIVDDSRTVRQQVADVLSQAGYEVVQAVDGVDAMDKIANCPDLAMLISDINMPRMNGLDLLARLKGQGGVSRPVLMLTTEGQAGPMSRAKELGAKGWIVKPFKPQMLLATIRKVLGD